MRPKARIGMRIRYKDNIEDLSGTRIKYKDQEQGFVGTAQPAEI